MSDWRRRLDDLMTGGRPPTGQGTPRRPAAPTSLRDVIGGRQLDCGGRACWLVSTPFEQVIVGAGRPGQLRNLRRRDIGGMTIEPHRSVVLDIETGGFSGVPLFLVGLVLPDQQPPTVWQYLARDYPEEEAVVRAFAGVAAQRDTWVTFNGKSFDEPFLRERARLHQVALPPPRLHVDLLHAARRRWRHLLPNCRLVTLEQEILGRTRIGDVPSADVPDLFHHFIRTGNATPLRPVLEHNRRDLVSCTELLLRLSDPA